MSFGVWELVLILVIVVIFFGTGKLSNVMGDVGKGIKNLRNELKKDDQDTPNKLSSDVKSENSKKE